MMQSSHRVDPVTAEILRNAFVSATDEMKTNLMRTAYNPIIYEALDYTVGLFDREGNTISIGLGLPMFIRGLSDAIKAKIAHYGLANIHPGDILLTNDAYIMGSHLNHLIFTLPIFHDDELVAFASSMAHWQDVGGVLGPSQDIYSEGLQLPIVKIFKRGQQDDELVDIIRTNVRLPERALGDMRAQIAAIKTGEKRFLELLERYGHSAITKSIDELFAQSERLARAAVATIPDGTYEATASMDDDGIGADPIPINVKVVVEGDQMTIDLSNVSPQVRGYFNSGATAGRSAAQVAFKCLTTPTAAPINDGQFSPLNIVLPPGRVVSAVKPAAMQQWMTIPMTVVDTIFRAVAQAVPSKTVAGHHADLCYSNVHGIDPRDGRFFVSMLNLIGGGWGARHDSDGMSATICINDGDTHNAPIEATETKLPVVVEKYGLREDSGGAGRHRGGLGVEYRVRMLATTSVNMKTDRTKCAPWGLLGGYDALPNRVRVERADGQVLRPPSGKLDALTLHEGDELVVESGGGGGFGHPEDRPPEAVIEDVRAGYVSREAARDHYKVRVTDDLLADTEGTRTLRTR